MKIFTADNGDGTPVWVLLGTKDEPRRFASFRDRTAAENLAEALSKCTGDEVRALEKLTGLFRFMMYGYNQG